MCRLIMSKKFLLIVITVLSVIGGFIGCNMSWYISGRVVDSAGNGIEKVKLIFNDSEESFGQITDTEGYWEARVIEDVLVKPSLDGFIFEPPYKMVSRKNKLNNNFTGTPISAP